MDDQPRWLREAWSLLGLRTVKGRSADPAIRALFVDAGHPEVTDDETAWCAAFVGACLSRSGLASTGSLAARSYVAFGAALAVPRLGAIAVFPRGTDPRLGHVGFVAGETEDKVMILGGNQSGGAVTVAAFAKDRLVALRWPETSDDEVFAKALAHVLVMEGGWTNDPHDPGGPTNRGLTLDDLSAHWGVAITPGSRDRLLGQLRKLDEATVREIYRTRYWRPSRAPDLPPRLALFHFDAAVNHGLGGAARMLQQALGVTVDGEIGPLTLAAARRANAAGAIDRYAALRRARYRSLPHFWRFGAGWLSRVDRTRTAALALPDTIQSATPAEKETEMSTEPEARPEVPEAKWWGRSMTIWGALITAASTVLPLVGPLIGLELSPEIVRQIGEQTVTVVQAIGGLIGTLMTVVGRTRAATRIERRPFTLQL
jgi:uncharacterized protein (TIGR02594 family)